jgi:hypothetical protein
VGGQRHAPVALPLGKDHCIGGRVGPRASLDGCGKSRPPPTGIRSPDRPALSESLYRLGHPDCTEVKLHTLTAAILLFCNLQKYYSNRNTDIYFCRCSTMHFDKYKSFL